MEYAQMKAMAQAMYVMPVGVDLPAQKYKRGWRVKVDDKMPPWMSHFESGFEGIVEYTHGQKYGGDDVDNYSLIVLDKDGKPVNSIAWYNECQLSLISDDAGPGLEIISRYKSGL